MAGIYAGIVMAIFSKTGMIATTIPVDVNVAVRSVFCGK